MFLYLLFYEKLRQNRRVPSVIHIPNSTVVVSIKYPHWVTKYFSGSKSDCHILVVIVYLITGSAINNQQVRNNNRANGNIRTIIRVVR